MKKSYIILVLVSLLWACNPAKQYIKKGNEFFLLGNYDDAATYFYNALLADPQNLEAKQALMQMRFVNTVRTKSILKKQNRLVLN
jgi:hypothetical protein